jgi:hypothetical protein
MVLHYNLFHAVSPQDVPKWIETLIEQFDCLHERLVNELSGGVTSVNQVLRALTRLPFTFRKEYESTIQSMLPELEEKKVIHNLFNRLNPLFTFVDYKLLHHLTMKFGSPELKKDMVTYAEQVQLFKKRTTINELKHYWPGLKKPQIDHEMLRAKFADDPKSYTLEKLDYFRNLFYSELRLSELVSVSILVVVESANSFIAVWFIPTVAIQELTEAISQIDRTFFQTQQVLELSLGERTLYQRNIAAEFMTSSAMGPLSAYTHVRNKIYLQCTYYISLGYQSLRKREEGSVILLYALCSYLECGHDQSDHSVMTDVFATCIRSTLDYRVHSRQHLKYH